jgi:hypothetical protein
MPAGLTNQVTLRTYIVGPSGGPSEGTPATVELSLIDRGGQERFRKAVQTNDIGQATVEIPGEALQPGVRLEVAQAKPVAFDADAELPGRPLARAGMQSKPAESVTTDLPVQPEPQLAYFLLAEPTIEPGKSVPFSLWNFAAFSANPGPPEQSQAALESVEGIAVTESAVTASLQEGLVNGVLQVKQSNAQPDSPALGAVANAPRQSLADVRLRQAQPTVNARAEQLAELEQSRRKAANEVEKIAQAGQTGGQSLPRLETRTTTIAAGKPITVTIPDELARKAVLAAAICRGVTVGTASVTESKPRTSSAASRETAQSSENQVSLALPPEADGWIEVALFDRSTAQAEPAHREFVYREPLRKLQIELPDIKPRFAPGEEVQLTLRVTDENGRPAADTRLGVRVWNEQLVRQSAEQPVLLAEAVHGGAGTYLGDTAPWGQPAGQDKLAAGRSLALSDQVRSAKELKQVDEESTEKKELDSAATVDALQRSGGRAYLPAPGYAGLSQSKGAGAVAAALALPESIELASNREAVKAAVHEAATRAESRRRRAVEAIGGAAIFGGIAVLLLMGMLAVLRMAASARAAAPALIAAVASLLIGSAWIGWLPQPRFGQIAMAPEASTTAAPADDSPAPINDPSFDVAAAPSPTSPAAAPAAGLPAGPQLQEPQRAAGTLREASDAAPPAAAPFAAGGAAPVGKAKERDEAVAAPAPTPSDTKSAAGVPAEAAAAPQSTATSPARGGGAFRFQDLAKDQSAESSARPKAAAAGALAAGAAGRAVQPSGASAPAVEARIRGLQPADDDAAKALRLERPAAKYEAAVAPAALFFDPQLMTDADGRATVRFVMPPVDSEYRLLIDALGHGRIGSRQQLIVCGSATAK